MQRFRKPLLILAGIIGGFVLLLLAASLLLAGKAKSLAVDQINRYLSVPVSVQDIQFSLIRNFPYASISFENISSKGSATLHPKSQLAQAERIYLLYNLTDLFSDDLHLKKIIISNASFYLYTDAEGNTNYDILKEQKSGSASSKIELEDVELENVHIEYIDLPANRDYRVLAQETKLKGAFTKEIYDLNIEGPLLIELLKINQVTYLNQKQTETKLQLNIDTRQDKYTILHSSLKVADMEFDVNGFIASQKDANLVDLVIKSREAGIRELLSLIPGVYTEGLDKYRYDGKVEFNLGIKGRSGKKVTPLVTASFSAANASLMTKGENYAFRNITLNGDYTSRISDTRPVSRLRLSNLRATMQGTPLTGNLLVEDFSNPAIDLQLKSKVNLEVLSKFWLPDTLSSMSGIVNIDAHMRGRSHDRNSWTSEGVLDADNLTIALKNRKEPFTNITGRLTLKGSQLIVSGLKAQSGGSDFTFNGNFDNAYGYLFSKTENLNGNLTVNSANIDLGELLETHTTSKSDTVYRFDPDPRLHIAINCSVGMIQFKKFQAWQLKGKLNIDGKIIRADNFSFRGFQGTTNLNALLNGVSKDSLTLVCEADVKRLDINELFYQLGNFGQDVIVADNVSGKLTATIRFAGTWGKDLRCNMDRIVSQSTVLIENGELKQFKPILSLNKYIKGADFQHIKFNTLKNEVDIRNQTITIPNIHIQSSALDLTASGTHTFTNVVNYRMQLYLSQLLGKKVKDQNTEFGYVEDDGLGKMKIFLTMTGPMANPKVVFDKKAVEQKITQDIRKEKDEFRNIIRKEFQLGKKDTATVKPVTRKQEELELESDAGD